MEMGGGDIKGNLGLNYHMQCSYTFITSMSFSAFYFILFLFFNLYFFFLPLEIDL